MPPIEEVQSLNHWTAKEVPETVIDFFWSSFRFTEKLSRKY